MHSLDLEISSRMGVTERGDRSEVMDSRLSKSPESLQKRCGAMSQVPHLCVPFSGSSAATTPLHGLTV